jgi:hypothetical protein
MTDIAANLPDSPVSPEGPSPTSPTAVEVPVVGRSLFGDAWLRLKANKAAMFSLYYLMVMAVVCIVGPFFSPHNYATIYPTMCACHRACRPIRTAPPSRRP